jgi:L-malate glycosyltransferase
MMRQQQVIIAQRRLTHYRVPLFEKLRGTLGQRNIGLRLLVGEETEEEKSKQDSGKISWAERVPTRYWMRGKICWQPTYRYINGADLVIVTQETFQIANQFLVLSPLRPKVAFWGHGVNFQSRNPDGLKERYKAWVSRRVDWWFAYTALSADAVMRTGFDPARITTLNNAAEIVGGDTLATAAFRAESAHLRESLGLKSARIGIFVGSLYRDKRLDFLLEALGAIKDLVPEFGFVFVGDGPDRTIVSRFCRERNWAVWVGPKFGRDKLSYLWMARVILNPGAVGLGILDSFAVGVPMVTTDCKRHGPEIAYLANGKNGRLTGDSLTEFVTTAIRLLTNDEEWRLLRSGALRSAEEYSLDNMVARFAEGIVCALDTDVGASKKSTRRA